jgi:hypothetical protein
MRVFELSYVNVECRWEVVSEAVRELAAWVKEKRVYRLITCIKLIKSI